LTPFNAPFQRFPTREVSTRPCSSSRRACRLTRIQGRALGLLGLHRHLLAGTPREMKHSAALLLPEARAPLPSSCRLSSSRFLLNIAKPRRTRVKATETRPFPAMAALQEHVNAPRPDMLINALESLASAAGTLRRPKNLLGWLARNEPSSPFPSSPPPCRFSTRLYCQGPHDVRIRKNSLSAWSGCG
jgi:hypothetical protein